MIKDISDNNKIWLIKHVPDAEQLMLSSVGDLLDALYDVIDEKGFDADGDYNAFGLAAQNVYDDIYEFAESY